MTNSLKLRQTLELEITSLNAHGQAQAFFNEKLINVDNAFPGDKVKCAVNFISNEKIFAKAFELMRSSPLRITPFCQLARTCGGCSWQEIAYDNQLKFKQQIVANELKQQQLNIEVHPTCPSPSQAYRSKIQLPVHFNKGKIQLGYFKKNSHEIIDLENCPIHPSSVNTLTRELKKLIIQNKIPIYDEKKHKGLLRHILIRFSIWEQKSILTFVVNADSVPDSMIKLKNDLLQNEKNFKAIVINFNTEQSNTILGIKDEVVWGNDLLDEVVNDKHFFFSSKSFFQTNIAVTEKICEKVQSLFKGGTLLDLYSGVGLYAVLLGEKAKNITCVEYSKTATAHAINNLKANGLDSKSECFAGDVLKFLENYAHEQKCFDTIIVNPPRKGLDKRVRELLPTLVKQDLLYISCSPVTLARDLKELSGAFDIKEVFPFDMFPHTHHVENVVHLKKK